MIKRGQGEFETYIGDDTPIKVRWYGYIDPGRLSGPPEQCYPPEEDMVWYPVDGKYKFEISSADKDRIEQMCRDLLWEARSD